MGKNIKLALITLATLLVALLAGSALSSYLVKHSLANLQSNIDNHTSIIVTSLKHNAGLVHSSGTVFLNIQNKCIPDLSAQVKVNYVFHHLPLPWAPIRADIQLYPTGELADQLDRVAGGQFVLSGDLTLTPLGWYNIKLNIPALSTRESTAVLAIPANTLKISYADPAIKIDWQLLGLELRNLAGAVTVKNVVLDFKLSDLHKGLGSFAFNIQQVVSSHMLLDAFSLAGRVEESNNRIVHVTAASAKKLQLENQLFKDMMVESKVSGIDEESYYFFSNLMQKTCVLNQLSAIESQQTVAAVRKILTKGASFQLSKLSAAANDGNFSASLDLELKEHTASELQISFAKHLSGKGSFKMSGNLLPQPQKQMLLDLGFSVLQANDLVSSFEFSNSKLTLNNNPAKQELATKIEEALVLIDAYVNKMLTSKAGEIYASFTSQTVQLAAEGQAASQVADVLKNKHLQSLK
jgi:hypothetical protein